MGHRECDVFTPGRGRFHEPKVKGNKYYAQKLREEECCGDNVNRTDEAGSPMRKKCALCKSYTASYCLGCKPYLCFDKKRDIISPHTVYKSLSWSHTSQEWTTVHFSRSCYHIAHEKQREEKWQQLRYQPTHYERIIKKRKQIDP